MKSGDKHSLEEPEKEGWISRQDGTMLISEGQNEWIQTRSTAMYVRPCYPTLWNLCKGAFTHRQQGVAIVGTPGIGKSCFLDYALHRFVQEEGKRVLYLYGSEDQAFIFQRGVATKEGSIAEARSEKWATGVDLVLFDPPEDAAVSNSISRGIMCGKNFIVAMSPDPENCKKLRKDTVPPLLYMGTLSLQEAEDMRTGCYPDISKELLQARYPVMGGIPRFLFRSLLMGDDTAIASVELSQKAAIEHIAISSSNLIDTGQLPSQFKSLWSVYHLQPRKIAETNDDSKFTVDHMKFTIEPCSEDCRIRIRSILLKKSVEELWRAFERTEKDQGTIRGIRYEAYVHKKIMTEGLHGQAKGLILDGFSEQVPIHVDIPSSLPKIQLPTNDLGASFEQNIQAAKDKGGAYLLSFTSNFPVIDSIFVSKERSVLLQVKVGGIKPLKPQSADTIFSATGGIFVFVVPDEFVIRKAVNGGPARMNQYVLVLRENI
jgi:hypothetical protein